LEPIPGLQKRLKIRARAWMPRCQAHFTRNMADRSSLLQTKTSTDYLHHAGHLRLSFSSAARRSTQLFFRMKDASKPLLAEFLGTLFFTVYTLSPVAAGMGTHYVKTFLDIPGNQHPSYYTLKKRFSDIPVPSRTYQTVSGRE
jgi:hypothetical protein